MCSGYVAVLIVPSTWAFYFTSVLIGVAAASECPGRGTASTNTRPKVATPTVNALFSRLASVLWTAQGQFLVENSEASTINRNTGVFWALLQCRYSCQQSTGHMTPPEAERNSCLCVFPLFVLINPSFCSEMIRLLRL